MSLLYFKSYKKGQLNVVLNNYLNVIAFLSLDPATRNKGTPIHVITTNSPNATSPIDKISGSPYNLFNIQPMISPLKTVGQIDATNNLIL